MQVCLSQGLGSAFEVSRNLLLKDELTQVQKRNLEMALCLIIISKRFFDYITNRKDVEILKNWTASSNNIRKYYLAKKSDGKCYLYASYIDIPDKDLGIYVSSKDQEQLLQLSEKDIKAYWNNALHTLGYESDQDDIVQMNLGLN